MTSTTTTTTTTTQSHEDTGSKAHRTPTETRLWSLRGLRRPSWSCGSLLLLTVLVCCCAVSSSLASPITINYASSTGYKPPNALPRTSIPILRNDDCDFYVLAKVGSSGEYYRMALDTGAKSTLADASTCGAARKYADVHCFDPTKSKTYTACGDSCRSPYISMQHRACLRMGLDDFSFANSTLPTTKGFAICLCEWSYYSFDHCDGILGLQASDVYVPQSDVTYLFDNTSSPIFALELNANNDTPSYMHVGGWDPSYKVVWSESTSVRNQYQSFMMYHLSMCGIDLFEGTTSFVLTSIFSRYPLVLVPQFILDMIIHWMPASCSTSVVHDYQLQCSFKTKNASQEIVLPMLTFQLSENSSPLYLPLASLIEKQTFDPTRNQTTILFSLAYHTSLTQSIYLGLPGLQNFYSVFDNHASRVGLAQHHNFVPGNLTDGCKAPVLCDSDQTYDPLTNTCKDINCNVYYLQELDKQTQECRLKKSSLISIFIVFAFLTVAELMVTRLYSRMVSKVLKIFPTNNSASLLPHPRRD